MVSFILYAFIVPILITMPPYIVRTSMNRLHNLIIDDRNKIPQFFDNIHHFVIYLTIYYFVYGILHNKYLQ